MIARSITAVAVLFGITACNGGVDAPDMPTESAAERPSGVALASDWDARLEPEELERGRFDPAWSRTVRLDTAGLEDDTTPNPETWDDITPRAVNLEPMRIPISGDMAGPSVLRVQVLLDRALFSPGIIDARMGKNTEKAIYWFQHREGLRTTGRIDQETLDRLVGIAGTDHELVRTHRLTEEDVEGPFAAIPDDIYDKAELDCLCYESLTEKLAETFHTSPELLRKLNPGVDLDALNAGDEIAVPSVRPADAGRSARVNRLVVSGDGFYVHALDAAGRILFHFPSTLGSSFDPSPSGDHRITSITEDPWWHYQPSLLAHVDDEEPEAQIPPGPNNAVGVVWMALSIPHYGIHGTSAPETIGYATSAGCVRLTNWDAHFLADRIDEGIPVEFTPPS